MCGDTGASINPGQTSPTDVQIGEANIVNNFKELPFSNCTDYQVINEFALPIQNLLEKFENNCFSNEMFKHINMITKDNYSCKYYTESSFPSALNQNKISSFKVFHTNIRSLQLHSFELLAYLESLKCKFDVILLTELGKPNIGFVENIFKGYKLYYQESSRCKGVAGALIRTSSFDSVTILEGN